MRVSAQYRQDTDGVVYANNVVIYDPKLQQQPQVNQKLLVRIYGASWHRLKKDSQLFLQQLIEELADGLNEDKEVNNV